MSLKKCALCGGTIAKDETYMYSFKYPNGDDAGGRKVNYHEDCFATLRVDPAKNLPVPPHRIVAP